MTIEDYVKLVDFAWNVAQKSPESIRTKVFEITYSTLLTRPLPNNMSIENPKLSDMNSNLYSSVSLNYEQKLIAFSNECNITENELKDVFYIDDDQIHLLSKLSGSDAEKQAIASMCILTSYQMLFDKEWLDSVQLMKCVSNSLVGGMDHFARNMRRRKNLLVRGKGKGAVLEYKITNAGKLETFAIIQDLLKGE